MLSNTAIKLENVSKIYKIYKRPIDRLLQMLPWNKNKNLAENYKALSSVDLEINKGDVIGLVGQNGAGKSTLLQLVCKTLEPSSGRIEVNGKISALLELGSGFNPEFTGRENVYMAAAIAGLSKEETDKNYNDIVEFSGIADFINNPVKTYSSGMMVRLAFAVAISVKPDILVIDEALSVGDGAFARKSFDKIMQLKDSGCTILFCSHSLYQVEVLCNKVMWLHKGDIKAFGEPSGVINLYQKFLDGLISNNEEIEQSMPRMTTNSSNRIKKINITDENQQKNDLKIISDESTVNIEVLFSCDINLPKPTIGILITDDQLKNISSCGTFYDKVEPKIDEKGNGKTKLIFPKIGLRKGRYLIHVFLMCENAIHIYDGVQCGSLEVTQKGSEIGVVSLPRRWE